jgi:hypothetical protein
MILERLGAPLIQDGSGTPHPWDCRFVDPRLRSMSVHRSCDLNSPLSASVVIAAVRAGQSKVNVPPWVCNILWSA